jgi:hypothetical protein
MLHCRGFSRDATKERNLALLREGTDLGTGGRISWSRVIVSNPFLD